MVRWTRQVLGVIVALPLLLVPMPCAVGSLGFASAGIPGTESPSVPPLPTAVVLSKMAVSYGTEGSAVVGPQTVFSGRVVSLGPDGEVGADPLGSVVIQEYRSGAWNQVSFETYPDTVGYFSMTSVPFEPSPGMQYRAVYSGTNTAAASTSAPLVAPSSSAHVKVRAVSGRSKLRVNVGPNLAHGNWKFVVSRNMEGTSLFTWVAVFKTKGQKEVRTIDLPPGIYKVYVYPQRGHAGAWSAQVQLLR